MWDNSCWLRQFFSSFIFCKLSRWQIFFHQMRDVKDWRSQQPSGWCHKKLPLLGSFIWHPDILITHMIILFGALIPLFISILLWLSHINWRPFNHRRNVKKKCLGYQFIFLFTNTLDNFTLFRGKSLLLLWNFCQLQT